MCECKRKQAFRVLEEVHELANILVLDGSMDLDFGHQLLLGSASLQRGLVDDLGRTNTLRLALHKLIALGKATLSKEFTLDVLAERGVSVLVLDSLFDDLGIGAAVATRAVKVGLAATCGGSARHELVSRGASPSTWARVCGTRVESRCIIV